MEDILLKIQEIITLYGLKIITAILIFIIGRICAGIFGKALEKILRKSKVEQTFAKFICNIFYIGIMTFVVVASLGHLGIQTASFIAIIGSAGLAIGLAFQSSLANLASGVLLIIFKPFKIGDFVEGGGISGYVVEIAIFATTFKTPDNKKIIVPNSKLTSDNIINYSAADKRRIDLVIGVSYDDNLDKVKKILQDILDNESKVLKEPAYTIGVLELADSSVNLAVRPWVKTFEYWPAYFCLMENIKKRFDEEGVVIPYPQRDIHIYSEEKQ